VEARKRQIEERDERKEEGTRRKDRLDSAGLRNRKGGVGGSSKEHSFEREGRGGTGKHRKRRVIGGKCSKKKEAKNQKEGWALTTKQLKKGRH